jgi:hypothetical protein
MMRTITGLILTLISSVAGAYTSEYQLNFGPYVGGGDISNGARVRHTSGYTLAVERNWKVNDSGLAIGPRVEVTNGFVNSKLDNNDLKSVATYDNRIFAAGIRISQTVGNSGTFAQGIYLTGVAGKGYSKLSIDDTGESVFVQRTYGNISGNFFGSELGGWIPLKENLGINIAFTANSLTANQENVSFTYESEVPGDSGLGLTTGSGKESSVNTLEDSVTMKTYAGRIGLSLGF